MTKGTSVNFFVLELGDLQNPGAGLGADLGARGLRAASARATSAALFVF